jgi:beta-lactamase regulating signal transducer with metallopeptidase domain
MTATELLIGLAKSDLALSAGALAAMALRLPIRRWLGARTAYGLWLLPLAASAAVLLPARIVTQSPLPPPPVLARVQIDAALEPAPLALAPAPPARKVDPILALSLLWAAGVLGCAGWFARGQLRFLKLARGGLAGPAAVGMIRPRVVTPADFETRFGRAERAAILAHEAAHIALQHPRANALAAAVQAAHWFNPLVHLAAHLMRIDQELACDAAVVAGRPKLRRLYAETLLKSQLSATPLPLGCYWPAKAEHPLTRRVEMLNRAPASRRLRVAGAAGVTLLTLAGGLGAWAAQPARVVVARATEPGPTRPGIRITSDTARPDPDGKSTTFGGNVTVEVGRTDPVTGQTVYEHHPHAVAPKAYTLTPDPDVAVYLIGTIERIEWSNPRAIIHVRDERTGRLWAIEMGTSNTLRRAGFDERRTKGPVEVSGLGVKNDRCRPECRALLREMTFADGLKVFLGSALSSGRTPELGEMQTALRAQDSRKAAMLGASAADIVRALQAKGREKGLDPEQAVVSIDAAGKVEVTPMKPLPALGADSAGGHTIGLGGSGFSFGVKPGTITLYPKGATSFGPAGPDGAPAGQWTAPPKPQSDSGGPGIIAVSDRSQSVRARGLFGSDRPLITG